jgi:plastocyanin
MKRVLLLAIALAAAAPAHAQHGHTETVSNEILLRQAEVAPARLTVLTGEKVSWRNVSIRKHTVTSPDGLFDSGEVGSNRSFSQAFAAPGDYAYFCKIHPSVKGVVAVRTAILSGPATAVRGETFTLSGRAAPGELPLLRDGRQAGLLTAGADGHFSTDLPADSTATWTVGGSDPVRVEVADRRTVALVRRGRRLHVSVSPPSPGGRVVLQQRRRERFGWWPIRSGRLGEDSTAMFKMPHRRAATRAVLTQADGATVLAVSNSWRPTRSR